MKKIQLVIFKEETINGDKFYAKDKFDKIYYTGKRKADVKRSVTKGSRNDEFELVNGFVVEEPKASDNAVKPQTIFLNILSILDANLRAYYVTPITVDISNHDILSFQSNDYIVTKVQDKNIIAFKELAKGISDVDYITLDIGLNLVTYKRSKRSKPVKEKKPETAKPVKDETKKPTKSKKASYEDYKQNIITNFTDADLHSKSDKIANFCKKFNLTLNKSGRNLTFEKTLTKMIDDGIVEYATTENCVAGAKYKKLKFQYTEQHKAFMSPDEDEL